MDVLRNVFDSMTKMFRSAFSTEDKKQPISDREYLKMLRKQQLILKAEIDILKARLHSENIPDFDFQTYYNEGRFKRVEPRAKTNTPKEAPSEDRLGAVENVEGPYGSTPY